MDPITRVVMKSNVMVIHALIRLGLLSTQVVMVNMTRILLFSAWCIDSKLYTVQTTPAVLYDTM